MANDKYDPPTPTKSDAAHALTRGALGAIPLAGSGAVELFNWLLTPPLERRRLEWMNDMAEGLRKLESSQHIDLEALRSNEAFVDVMLTASQAALRTSQQDKGQALRNVVLNAAATVALETSEHQIFVRMVDELTEWHLRLLKLFQDPRAHVPPNAYMGGLSQVVEGAFPALRGRRDFYDQVWADLHLRGLANTHSLHVMMTGGGMGAKRTTDLGDRFLAFIASPIESHRATL